MEHGGTAAAVRDDEDAASEDVAASVYLKEADRRDERHGPCAAGVILRQWPERWLLGRRGRQRK